MSQNQNHPRDVEFIGMIQSRKVSEIHAAEGSAIDRDYVRAFAQEGFHGGTAYALPGRRHQRCLAF